MQLQTVLSMIEKSGFTPRGGFHPVQTDLAPALEGGRPVATLILIGNAGPSMWAQFSEARGSSRLRLDDWSKREIDRLADELGAAAFYPFTEPYLPFQRWAQKAEPCHVSPLGVLIHPDYGLWHGYRGALGFADSLTLPTRDERPRPCDSCRDRPCLTTCPVSAFGENGYDVDACATHISSADGATCLQRGCLARHACPVGTEYAYEPAQAAFHMAAFLASRSTAN